MINDNYQTINPCSFLCHFNVYTHRLIIYLHCQVLGNTVIILTSNQISKPESSQRALYLVQECYNNENDETVPGYAGWPYGINCYITDDIYDYDYSELDELKVSVVCIIALVLSQHCYKSFMDKLITLRNI